MESITVGLEDRSYDIIIGRGGLESLGKLSRQVHSGDRVAVVTNPVVGRLYLEMVKSSLDESGFSVDTIEIPDGEEFKVSATLNNIYDRLIDFGFDRRSLLVALGGGVVGDITGYAAATYLRGIPFIQVPTTLLAQVDSSVGGKTGINHEKGKNLIGAFYQPGLVVIDTNTLDTLTERDYLSGLAEVVKYGVVLDGDFFQYLNNNVEGLLHRDKGCLQHVIKRSCEIKSSIVNKDEKESGLRAVLNYGHTLGHAVETVSGYGRYTHGEAVAIGMAQAARYSEVMGFSTREVTERIITLLKALKLPVDVPLCPASDYIEALWHDKKVRDRGINFVFNIGIGKFRMSRVEELNELLKVAGIGG